MRKQIRQMPNLRYTARDRPHNLQRRFNRVANFGVSLAFAILDLLATVHHLSWDRIVFSSVRRVLRRAFFVFFHLERHA